MNSFFVACLLYEEYVSQLSPEMVLRIVGGGPAEEHEFPHMVNSQDYDSDVLQLLTIVFAFEHIPIIFLCITCGNVIRK